MHPLANLGEAPGLIDEPLTNDDLRFLATFRYIYGKETYLSLLLAGIKKSRRYKLIETAGMDKIERYVFSRLKELPPGKRIRTSQLLDEIFHYLIRRGGKKEVARKVPLENKLKALIARVRSRVSETARLKMCG
jgi:hypothetical protein